MDRGTWLQFMGLRKKSTNTLAFTKSMMFLLSHSLGKAELDPDH